MQYDKAGAQRCALTSHLRTTPSITKAASTAAEGFKPSLGLKKGAKAPFLLAVNTDAPICVYPEDEAMR